MQIGEPLEAEVLAFQVRGQHVKFATKCLTAEGETLIDGEALAKLALTDKVVPLD